MVAFGSAAGSEEVGEEESIVQSSHDPNAFQRFLRSVLSGPPSTNSQPKDKDGQVEPKPHIVKITQIHQCPEAARDETLEGPRNERYCKPPTMTEELDPVVKLGTTTYDGNCTVCEAMERAEQEALNEVKVFSYTTTTDSHKPQASQGREQKSGRGKRPQKGTVDDPYIHGDRVGARELPRQVKRRRKNDNDCIVM